MLLMWWVVSLTLVGHLSIVTSVGINEVRDCLPAAIRKVDKIRSSGLVPVPVLLLAIIVAGLIILDSPVEIILGRGVVVFLGKGHGKQGKEGEEGLVEIQEKVLFTK